MKLKFKLISLSLFLVPHVLLNILGPVISLYCLNNDKSTYKTMMDGKTKNKLLVNCMHI